MTAEIELSRLDLDPSGALRRDPPRAPEHRHDDYDRKFDDTTVFFDCFEAIGSGQVVCIGPPLFNLEPVVVPAVELAFGCNIRPEGVRKLDRVCEVRLDCRRSSARFDDTHFSQRTLVVQPNRSGLFRGKRVLLTISKDNDLQWIHDWTLFHASNHGCNAVLLYDNQSSLYGCDRIRETLGSVPGIEVAVVLSWPYKFGPISRDPEMWDSDFAQYVMLEHARHRFLALAQTVLNADIDELVVTASGTSIFDHAVRSKTGYLRYQGVMIENVAKGEVPDPGRRFAHFHYRKRQPDVATPKWAVVPLLCPLDTQWLAHDVTKMTIDVRASDVTHRHFRPIRTPWRYPKMPTARPGPDHELDDELLDRMACFGVKRTPRLHVWGRRIARRLRKLGGGP